MSGSRLRALFLACILASSLPPGALAAGPSAASKLESLSDFEDGSLQSWHGRGNDRKEVLAVDASRHHGGAASLKVSGRTATWNGPQRELSASFLPGATYHVSAWILYADGPASASFTASIELGWKDAAVPHQYKNIATVKAAKGTWMQLEFDYVVPSDKNLSIVDLYFETPWKPDASVRSDDLIDFFIDDITVAKLDDSQKVVVQDDIPSLYQALADYFVVGTAVSPDSIDRADPHFLLLRKHYGALVPGNAMKPEGVQPKEGEFRFGDADKIVEFASMTGKAVRGHTLVWHQQTPAWFFADPKDPAKKASRELLLARLKSHIEAVVGHFKGDVYAWDVVNEVLTDDGRLRGGADGSAWGDIAGAEYIDKAFAYAHQADPEALLVINDYNLESSRPKRDAMYDLVKGMRARKVPVGAVGLQMHISIYEPSLSEIKETIEKFASLGVKVQVTELDVSIYRGDEPAVAVSDELFRAQAKRYGELFALFKEEAKKGNLDMVMLWGSADDDSWLDNFPVAGRPNAALLFDRRLRAKSAFWAIVDPSKLR
jgi:endo-1,4-beta-xylanase